jgi:iron complex outermembrane receptor protein
MRQDSYFHVDGAPSYSQAVDAAGGDLLARWNHTFAGGGQTSLQTYYDTYRRTDIAIPEVLRSFDLDFQHHFSAGTRHEIVWGLGFRASYSGIAPGYPVAASPPFRTDKLYSGFVQDEIRLGDSLWLTLGAKVEHNAYTGLQTEPSLRLAWSPPAGRHTVWAAASKAIRQPARADAAIQIDAQTVPLSPFAVAVVRLTGNPKTKNEELRDYELGYRTEFTKTLSFDATTFLSFYHHVQTLEYLPIVVVPGIPLQIVQPVLFDNRAHTVTYGGELSLRWNATSRWRISPGYSYLHATIRKNPDSNGTLAFFLSTGFPQNMAQVRSSLNLGRGVEFDQSVYYTARLPEGSIPGHARLDLRLARRFGERTEISLVGQNLLRHRATEYGDSQETIGSQVVRSVYGQIAWRF